MEPAEATVIKFNTTVEKITLYTTPPAPREGYYLQVLGLQDSIFVGETDLGYHVGDPIQITIRKRIL